MRLPRPRLSRRRIISASVATALLVAVVGWVAWPAPRRYTTEDRMLTVRSGPGGEQPVVLDTTLLMPKGASAADPVPVILLAHGFGGSKLSVATDAADFADRGYAVLTWTAEGFGRSGGRIHLDSPDYEVRDAQRLIDWLATRPEIRTDGPGDPRLGVVGGSYGGGLALLLAGYDARVDAIVPIITWNDLSRALLPESTGRGPLEGVFKRQWAGLLFGNGAGGLGDLAGAAAPAGTDSAGATGSNGGAGLSGRDGAGPIDPACGRFASDVCAAYQAVATTGRATAGAVALLRRSSPATVLDRITAPTLLIQGQADSLFPLTEADANARGIAAHGTPVRVDWFTGGHDGGAGPPSDVDRDRYLTLRWLDYYLRGIGADPGTGFTYSRITGIDAASRRLATSGFSAPGYPGLAGAGSTRIPVTGQPQRIANPPDGTPAALSTVPGIGGLATAVSGVTAEIPGQHADFWSAPLPSTVDIVGAPTIRLRVASPTGTAVLFVKLYKVDAGGAGELPFGLVAPVRLTALPATLDRSTAVTVTLPGIAQRIERGDRLRITVATADQGYATPVQPAVYTVALGGGGSDVVTLPSVAATPIASPEAVWRFVLAGLVLLVAIGTAAAVGYARLRRRRNTVAVVAEDAGTPLVVRGLRKQYGDGFLAVANADFTVLRGQVVGLLGPNGAGKTTALRVLLGLTKATAGEVLIFGHRLAPGSDVLTRVGALVEGPGFLPHLSGLDNLRLYWRCTGRPLAQARLDEALDIAALGSAVHRKVRTYSHGMKQRLAIAQAMLGLPELLVLDEPTDGLDPPQIAEMRRVLRGYATHGRAVLVSSHLLAEVEQTCTHVVVMHRGDVVATGEVDDVVGDSPIVQFDVSNVESAEAALAAFPSLRSVHGERRAGPDGRGGLVVDLDGTPRSEVVAALVHAGVGVDRVAPRRRLEDAFLALVGESKEGER
jgi:ABC-2 type transport system ATP-binding protein